LPGHDIPFFNLRFVFSIFPSSANVLSLPSACLLAFFYAYTIRNPLRESSRGEQRSSLIRKLRHAPSCRAPILAAAPLPALVLDSRSCLIYAKSSNKKNMMDMKLKITATASLADFLMVNNNEKIVKRFTALRKLRRENETKSSALGSRPDR
jgi:hypothetical protein